MMTVPMAKLAAFCAAALVAVAPAPVQDGFQQDLAWSPDGQHLVFSNFEKGNADLWIIKRDGTGLRRLASGPAADLWTSWSPDGRWIAFSSDREGQFEIFKVRTNGRSLTRLTAHPGRDYAPTWSPDGNHLAFTSKRGDKTHIYVMDADGRNPRQLTRGDRDYFHPVWSPSGRRLVAYTQEKDRLDQIVLVDDTTGEVTLIQSGERAFFPGWSADGRSIAYIRLAGATKFIMQLKADGLTPPHEIARGLPFFPRFSPVGGRLAWIETVGQGYPVPSRIVIARADGSRPQVIFDGSRKSPLSGG